MKPNGKLVLKVDGEIMLTANFNLDDPEDFEDLEGRPAQKAEGSQLSRVMDAISNAIEKSEGVELVEPMFRGDL